MRIIVTEYRGSGFYGNRPKQIRREEDVRLEDDIDAGTAAHMLMPVSWDELIVRPKRKGRRSCAH